MPKQLKCNTCFAIVSTLVPDQTIVRGWIECPECVYKTPDTVCYIYHYNDFFDDTIRYSIPGISNIYDIGKIIESYRKKNDDYGVLTYLSAPMRLDEAQKWLEEQVNKK